MKRTSRVVGVAAAAAALMGAVPAGAQPAAEARVAAPSVFLYGFDGFLLGAGAGLGAGYLSARAGGWHGNDWKDLAYGAGIGALAVGGLGLTLGIADMVNETQGRGYFILRDGSLGLGFGGVTGAIIGGLGALGSSKPEHVLLGAAIGGLAGTGAGVILGVVEAQHSWRRPARVALTVAPAAAAGGTLVWMPTLAGRY
jgi:hypothetical protein